MKQAYFVTGTDTEVGKTHVSCKLIRHFVAQGYKVVGMKPVAAGCELVNGQWLNDDVERLIAASNVQAPRAWVNPYCFQEPVAPHLAAKRANVSIDIQVIQSAFNQLSQLADIVIVEGAGGFLVPLNDAETLADLAVLLNLPVIVVVGIKLGAINHSLLTVEAISARQLVLHGWVANCIAPDTLLINENIETLIARLGEPLLVCDWQPTR